MGVRIEVHIIVTGDGETEQSIARSINELRGREHTSAYHEVMAQVLMLDARLHWRDADLYRQLEQQREQRLAAGRARREARQT